MKMPWCSRLGVGHWAYDPVCKKKVLVVVTETGGAVLLAR